LKAGQSEKMGSSRRLGKVRKWDRVEGEAKGKERTRQRGKTETEGERIKRITQRHAAELKRNKTRRQGEEPAGARPTEMNIRQIDTDNESEEAEMRERIKTGTKR
jgi:hypothetical protein